MTRTHRALLLAGLSLAVAGCSSSGSPPEGPIAFTSAMLAGRAATLSCQHEALYWRFDPTGSTVTSRTETGTWSVDARGKLVATFPSVEEVVTLQADLGPSLEVTRFQTELAEPIQTCVMTLD